MAIEVKVPQLPESVADATVAVWHKSPGDTVNADENLVDIETDKVMLEVPAPGDGVLKEIIKSDGSTVLGGEVIAIIEVSAAGQVKEAAVSEQASAPVTAQATSVDAPADLSPAVRRLIDEHQLDLAQIHGSGKGGRIVKQDVMDVIQGGQKQASAATPAAKPATQQPVVVPVPVPVPVAQTGTRVEQRVPMTRLRKRIAERLLEAQHSNAILTTFNEVDLDPIMAIRKRYQDQFVERHGIKLGFMSFFIKACCEALKRFPLVNASIDGNDIVYHGYFDIGVAVSTERGLVVPIIRDADQLNLAGLEQQVASFGNKARKGEITIEEMTGGTFTVSNGGVFGSLLSTPILNPPQSAILGMHKIEKRPVVINNEIVIRPMMYVALSYDHRIIDGKESVSFLRAIKEFLEDPTRLLLDL